MCGIAGGIGSTSDSMLRWIVGEIVQDQIARGPDAQGIEYFNESNRTIVLGHNRLSIIDLSKEANQPMFDASGRLVIIFNGEIYNYLELKGELEPRGARFRTQSDTEVILEAYRHYGVGAFSRFIGMFAFALYDRDARRFLLVRDRFGVKPLYWHRAGARIVFASTGRVIARALGLPPSLDYAARGLGFKIYDDDTSISPYEGLEAVPAGCYLSIDLEHSSTRAKLHRWYDIAAEVAERADQVAGMPTRDCETALIERLGSAVEMRLRSDVPVGISLSGGVDSAVVAGLVVQTSGRRPIAYTFGHPDAPESEGPEVAQIARLFGADTRYIRLERGQDVADLFWRTLHAQDAPFPSMSVMAQHAVFQRARADGTIVLLGGQGGDEAFMGYRKFFLFWLQEIVRRREIGAIPGFLAAALPLARAVLPRTAMFWSERRRYTKGGGWQTRLRLPQPNPIAMGLGTRDTLVGRQVLDVTRLSLPTLLRYEDRNSMGNSVESRLPFMDHRVIEFGLALPVAAKLHNGFGKWLLRSAAKGIIPESVRLNRDKRGFDLNQRRWIQAGLGDETRAALEERRKDIVEWYAGAEPIAEAFSDARLASAPNAFCEAVTLIWLADCRRRPALAPRVDVPVPTG